MGSHESELLSYGAFMKLLVYSDLHLDLCPLKLQLDPDFLKTIDVVAGRRHHEGLQGLKGGSSLSGRSAI